MKHAPRKRVARPLLLAVAGAGVGAAVITASCVIGNPIPPMGNLLAPVCDGGSPDPACGTADMDTADLANGDAAQKG